MKRPFEGVENHIGVYGMNIIHCMNVARMLSKTSLRLKSTRNHSPSQNVALVRLSQQPTFTRF